MRINFRRYPLLLILFLVFVFFLYPVGIIFYRSFFIDGSFRNWNVSLFVLDSVSHNALIQSILIAVFVAIGSSILGLIASAVMFRLSFFGKSIIEICFLAPFFLPPFIGLVGLKSIFNSFGLFPITIFKAGSFWGIVLLQILHCFPLCYLTIRSSLEKIPYDAIEAARLLGADTVTVLRRIVLPLLFPAIAAGATLSIVASLSDVGTPLLFEYRSHIAVQIFNTVFELPLMSAGYVLALISMLIILSVFLCKNYFEKLPTHFDTRTMRPWSFHKNNRSILHAFGIATCIVLASVSILPHISLLLVSLSKTWFMTSLPEQFSIHAFAQAFSHPLTSRSFMYSLLLSLSASFIVVWISFFISFSNQWHPSRLASVTTYLSLLPLAIPGLIIGFGMAIGFAGTIIDPKNAPTILLIAAYVIRKLPFAVIVLSSAVKQIPKVYEEAALIAGASHVAVFRFILFPLFRSILGSIFVVVLLSSLFEVSASLLLPMEEKYFPIAKALYALQSRPDGSSLTAAYAIIVMIVVVSGFYFTAAFQRRTVASLIRGVSS